MKRFRWFGPSFSILVAVSLQVALSAHAQASRFGPALEIKSRYDDNLFGEVEGTEGFVTLLTPELGWRDESRTSRIDFLARRRFYSDSRSRSFFPQTDMTALGFDHRFSEIHRLALDAGWQRSRDPIAIESASRIAQGRTAYGHAAVGIDLWRADVNARLRRWQYDEPGLTDGSTVQADATLFLTRTGVNSWIGVVRHEDYSLSGSGSLAATTGTLGLRRALTETVTAQVEAGATQRDRGDLDEPRQRAAFAFELTGTSTARVVPISVHVAGRRQLVDTGEVTVSTGWAGARWFASWQRQLEALGGIDDAPTITERWSTGVGDTLWRGTRLSLRGSVGRAWPLETQGRRTRLVRAVASVAVPISGWLTQETEYEFVQQSEKDRPDPTEFRRNRVAVSLRAALP